MTKLVPVAMALSALAATAMGLASPAFSQGTPRVECNQSWVPAIQNCRVVNNNPGYGAWGYVAAVPASATAFRRILNSNRHGGVESLSPRPRAATLGACSSPAIHNAVRGLDIIFAYAMLAYTMCD
jgi:hypothetical protein